MRRFLLLCVMSFVAAFCAKAEEMSISVDSHTADQENVQEELRQMRSELDALKEKEKQTSMWGRQKALKIGIADNTWTPEAVDGEDLGKFKPNYGYSLGLNKTYFLHRRAIAGCLKFGIEVTWFDLSYINYKANPNWSDHFGSASGYYDEFDIPNVGSNQIDIAMGLGISANVAPFSGAAATIHGLSALNCMAT